MPQAGGDFLQFGFFTDRDRLRLRVDFGSIGKDGTLEAGLDDAVVLDIKIGKEGNKRERKNCECA